MIRLFGQHNIRRVEELDGIWDLITESDSKKYKIPVPGCWEQQPDLCTYRGTGTYFKTVYVDKAGALRLEFKGVSHTADVYFDDKLIAHHYNAYTPFSAVVKNVEVGKHEIKVVVDNSFGEHSALHVPNDYYTYGGLIRTAVLEQVSNTFIKSVRFTPYKEKDIWYAVLEATIYNTSSEEVQVALKSKIDQTEIEFESITVPSDSERIVSITKEFPNVESWSNENPALYEMNTVLYINETPIDDLIERIGFRQIECKGTSILLNGEKIFLKGFNRHEDYAIVGCSIPLQLMIHDMDLMQDMGVNAVRTSHYPNDELFLDLCDERGILVWEENHARGLEIDAMLNPNFDKQCEDCITEMIDNHYNHPSILIWGILNECASQSEEGRVKYTKQYKQIKEMDQSRPTTSATCKHFTDICLDLPDIISYNIYSGWYEDISIKERNDREIEWLKKAGGEGKPFIVSEFGAAGMYGYRDRTRCKWSEERQSDIIEECLNVYMNDENISGVFIWQFCDCRVTEEGMYSKTRARCHNNKGVVDEYRRPKMAYDTVKKIFEG